MEAIFEIFRNLGFSDQEILLLKLCPLFSMIGGTIHMAIIRIDPSKIPQEGWKIPSFGKAFEQLVWIFLRLLLSASVGIVLALYLVGALQDDRTVFARILALALILGFAAPKLWLTQEKIVTDYIDKKVKFLLEQGVSVENK